MYIFVTVMTKLRWGIAQYVEIRWWQNYLKKKSPEKYLEWKTNYWRDFLERAGVELTSGEQALDAGCGPAGVFTVLNGLKVDAIDPLLDLYEKKLDHFKKAKYPNVSFTCVSLEDFKPETSYDIIFCLNAINHVDDLGESFDKLVSCLKPGGQLIVSIDAHNFQSYKRLFRLIPFDILHPHQYDLAEYRDMLVSRGLSILNEVRFEEHYFFNYYAMVCRKNLTEEER